MMYGTLILLKFDEISKHSFKDPPFPLLVRGLVILEMWDANSAIGVQFPTSAKYHVMLTLGNST